jgi:hypothetical protein
MIQGEKCVMNSGCPQFLFLPRSQLICSIYIAVEKLFSVVYRELGAILNNPLNNRV